MSERNVPGRGQVYERVTARIVAAIEAGAGEYEMPWHRGAKAGFPKNAATGQRYHGINVAALWSSSMDQGYASSHWATYLQWEHLGAQVRKGEKGSPVIFYKFPDREEANEEGDDLDDRRNALLVRLSHVFNEEQIDGWQSDAPPGVDLTTRLQAVEAFLAALQSDVRYGGTVAAYNRIGDYIRMPDRSRFIDTGSRSATEAFYSILLHEQVHWTGHELRLNRNLTGRFGDRIYAMEELNAELGAAFLCAELGISVEPRQDHAAYVGTWLSVLRDDRTAIAKAAKAATLASDYLMKLATEVPVME